MKLTYVRKEDIPTIGIDQMKEIDELMIKEIGVSLIMMMENAGRSLAKVSRYLLGDSILNKNIVIFSGKGNNGGGVLAAARHLLGQGAKINIIIASQSDTLKEAPLEQLRILKNSEAVIGDIYNTPLEDMLRLVSNADLILDGLIGYNLTGDPQEPISDIIDFINNSNSLVLANDIPSGLNGDLGISYEPTIKATATVTLALPKHGVVKLVAKEYVGDLFVANLTVPQKVYSKLDINVPIFFDKNDIVKIV